MNSIFFGVWCSLFEVLIYVVLMIYEISINWGYVMKGVEY